MFTAFTISIEKMQREYTLPKHDEDETLKSSSSLLEMNK